VGMPITYFYEGTEAIPYAVPRRRDRAATKRRA
jgi:hypothetical protein